MNKTLWIAVAAALVASGHAMTSSDKDLAFNSYNNAFYVSFGTNGHYVVDTNRTVPGRGDFWRVCEEIEAAEDSYDRTQSAGTKSMVTALLNALNNVVSGTTDFASWNKYNDDVMWAVIALGRGYEITGNTAFLTQAEVQFNEVWSRGWDNTLGGGLWWTTDKQSKNACVNGPATIAAMILARNTTNTGFRNQANQTYGWLRASLYNASTGQVADHMNLDGSLTTWAFSYNQGTFAGAAALLFADTSTTSYRSDAAAAVNWTRSNLTGQHIAGILDDEYDSNGGSGDTCGFKGIFVRWAAKYATIAADTSTQGWLTTNANAAWSYRDSSGITWGQWWHRTPDGGLTSWECSGALAVTQTAP